MIDVFNLADSGLYNMMFFPTSTSWQTWQKPSGIKFIYFYVIGSGGAGGGGRTGGFNSGGGGGGGGSSAISIGVYPAFMLPDILYVQVGKGPNGAAAGSGAASGALSYVSIEPNTTAINIIMASGGTAAGGGGGGTNTGGGGGSVGSAGTVWSYTVNPLAKVGMITTIAGQAGSLGGTNLPAAGGNITPIIPVTGGTGGGGVTTGGTPSNGGNIVGSGFLSTLSGGTGGNPPGAGTSGYCPIAPSPQSYSNQIMFFTGGTGGGASTNAASVTGGTGGNASFGSGGGGGGASYSGTGGTGGRGGDGLVLITCW